MPPPSLNTDKACVVCTHLNPLDFKLSYISILGIDAYIDLRIAWLVARHEILASRAGVELNLIATNSVKVGQYSLKDRILLENFQTM